LAKTGSMLQRLFPKLSTLVKNRQQAMQLAADPASPSRVGSGPQSHSIRDEWLQLVQIFTARELKVASDKHVAVAELARMVWEESCSGAGKDEYLAGVWRSNFIKGLCWRREIAEARHSCQDEQHTQALPDATATILIGPSEYRAPSWSWAAVDGEIEFSYPWLGEIPEIPVLGRAERETMYWTFTSDLSGMTFLGGMCHPDTEANEHELIILANIWGPQPVPK